jgi:hypothetical protein
VAAHHWGNMTANPTVVSVVGGSFESKFDQDGTCEEYANPSFGAAN